MSQHNEDVKVNFGSTAILSFVIVFALFLLMSNCHGPYQLPGEKVATEKSAEK